MTRTLHLINGLGTGGAERSLAELLPDLPEFGIQPEVLVFHRRDEGVEDEIRQRGIEIHHVMATSWARRIREVRRIIRHLDPALVHTTLFEADVVGRTAALGTRPRVVSSLVNTSYEPVRLRDPNVRRARLRAAQTIDAASARVGADHFHAISDAVRRSAIDRLRLRPGQISVIPRGRKRSRLGEPGPKRRRAVRERLGISADAELVLHVGREEYQKGHVVLLDALSPLFSQRPGLVLVMAGRRGSASAALDHRLAALPPMTVRRLGHVDEVPDLLAASDVFAFPSHYEGLGGAALEAMAMELPVVASDLPALREFLDDVAYFVEPSAASLRSQIQEVLDHPRAARDRAQTGRRRFDERFEHQRIVGAMADLFLQCAPPSRDG